MDALDSKLIDRARCAALGSSGFEKAGLKRCGALLAAALLLLLLVGCEQPPARSYNYSGNTMGTYWTVQLVPPPADDDQPQADFKDDIQSLIEQSLETVNSQMSTYRPDAHITRFNQASAGTSIQVPPEFASVLETALAVAEETDGLFDPTIGPLVNLWGFGPEGMVAEVPDEQLVAKTLERIGWHRIVWDRERRLLTQPGGLHLDFSAIAKGYAVDLIAKSLEARGIDSYLVNIGGDMRASGNRPDATPWRIGVERPHSDSPAVHSVIQVGNKAVVTSGSYRNFFEADGQYYSHTIDPRHGHPVPNELVSVSVVHSSCMMADAYATAISVMGLEAGMQFAQDKNLAAFLLVKQDDRLDQHMTEAFRPFLQQPE